MRGIIYKYVSPSGKYYIGQTTNEEDRRYKFLNLNQSYGSSKINNARKKYNPEKFSYEILYEHESDSLEELRLILGEKEVEYIKQFDSIKQGYNYQEGGLYVANKLSKETRIQIAKKLSKAIIQYSIKGVFIKEWESSKEIERNLGINNSSVRQNCSGKTSHCREFIFKFKTSDIYPLKIEVKEIELHKTRRLSISQFNTNGEKIKTWKTISSASRELSIDRGKLRKLTETEEIYLNYIYKIEK